MTNSEILAKYILTDTRVIVAYHLGDLHDKTNPMSAVEALPMVESIEKLGAEVSVYRVEA